MLLGAFSFFRAFLCFFVLFFAFGMCKVFFFFLKFKIDLITSFILLLRSLIALFVTET